jgi:hypothetical protein
VGGWAYSSKAAAPVDDERPPDWPPDWPPPPDDPTDPPPPVWPPDWPPSLEGFSMLVTVAAIKYNEASTVEAYCTEGGDEAPELRRHRIKVTADCNISTDGVTFYSALYYSVSNYTGAKYGIRPSLYFDIGLEDTGESIGVHCSVVTVANDISDSGSGSVELLVVAVTDLGSVEADSAVAKSVEMCVQDSDSNDIDTANGESIRVSAAIGSALVQVSSDGITFADYVDIAITNYSGTKYGFSQDLYFDVDEEDDGSALAVSGVVVDYESVTGTGTGTVEAGDMAYARAAGSSITKTGDQTVDGVACVAGDRVFCTDLGIYTVADGAWTAVKTLAQLATQSVSVAEGSANGGQLYVVSKAGVASKSVANNLLFARAAGSSITKSGNQTVDGIACVAGDRVFATDLGLYLVESGTWTLISSLAAMATRSVAIAEGTSNGKQIYVVSKAGAASKTGAVYL